MNYKFKMVLYIINKFIVIAALLGAVGSFAMAVIESELWPAWVIKGGISVAVYIIAKVISIFRKSKFPVAGIDYY